MRDHTQLSGYGIASAAVSSELDTKVCEVSQYLKKVFGLLMVEITSASASTSAKLNGPKHGKHK